MNRARLPTRGDAAVAAAVLEVLLAGALAWRRIAPLTVTVLVAALTTAEAVAGVPLVEPLVPLVAAVLAVYALGVHRPTVPALAGTAVLVAALGVQTRLQHKGIGKFLFGLIFAGGTWAVARVVRSRTGQTVALQARRPSSSPAGTPALGRPPPRSGRASPGSCMT